MPSTEASTDTTLPFPLNSEVPHITGVYNVAQWREKWDVVAQHLNQKEEARCKVWKEEVQNLLLFSGLFSAVVTAFLIELHKSLQQGPSETLLTRIATTLEHASNQTTSAEPFQPSYNNKVINALWFSSLVLSLTTALVGVVSLQWLREHLRPSTLNVGLRSLPAMVQMQADALDAYCVPQLFDTLPVLQILALILFFIGLIQFIWTIDRAVAFPSVVIISFTFGFILYTTFWPGIQGRPQSPTGREPRENARFTAPCPFKSPQSWAFFQILLSISDIISTLSACFRIAITVLRSMNTRSTRADIRSDSTERTGPLPVSDWIEWMTLWLRHRDVTHIHSKQELVAYWKKEFAKPQFTFPPIYNTLRALLRTKKDFATMGNKEFPEAMKAVLDAFDGFLRSDQYSRDFRKQLVACSHDVLGSSQLYHPFFFPISLFDGANLQIRRYECGLLFRLSGLSNSNEVANAVTRELCQWICHLLVASCDKLDIEINRGNSCRSPLAILWHEASQNHNIEYTLESLFSIVNKLTDNLHKVADSENTPRTSPYVKGTLHAIANIVTVEFTYRESSVPGHDDLLSILHNRLQSQGPRPYLFLLVSIYTHYLLLRLPLQFRSRSPFKRTRDFNALVQTLREQHTQLRESEELHIYQEWIIPHSRKSRFTWAYLDPQYDQQGDLGANQPELTLEEDILAGGQTLALAPPTPDEEPTSANSGVETSFHGLGLTESSFDTTSDYTPDTIQDLPANKLPQEHATLAWETPTAEGSVNVGTPPGPSLAVVNTDSASTISEPNQALRTESVDEAIAASGDAVLDITIPNSYAPDSADAQDTEENMVASVT